MMICMLLLLMDDDDDDVKENRTLRWLVVGIERTEGQTILMHTT